MKTGLSGIAKWLALAVFVLTAGCCYSCGLGGQPVGVSHAETLKAQESGLTAEASGSGNDLESGAASGSDEIAGDGSISGIRGQASGEDRPAEPESGETAVSRTCFVHVCGEVEKPGVYELTEGQRVFEAVELAGGFTSDAADSFLNLAEPVRDGMKILVPDRAMVTEELTAGLLTGGDAFAAAGEGTDKARPKININTASKEELMTLRGIGEARAEDIIRYRQQRGGFGSIEDIMEVSGIKDAAFQKIKDDITV